MKKMKSTLVIGLAVMSSVQVTRDGTPHGAGMTRFSYRH